MVPHSKSNLDILFLLLIPILYDKYMIIKASGLFRFPSYIYARFDLKSAYMITI
jgi:hypothetical protein